MSKEYADKSREERVTGNVPIEEASAVDVNSREYHAKHGWPETKKPKLKQPKVEVN